MKSINRKILITSLVGAIGVMVFSLVAQSPKTSRAMDSGDKLKDLPIAVPTVIKLKTDEEPKTWGLTKGNWKMALLVEEKTFDVGEEIPVVVLMKNISNKKVIKTFNMAYFSFSLLVRDNKSPFKDAKEDDETFEDALKDVELNEQHTRYYNQLLQVGYGRRNPKLFSEKVTVPAGHCIAVRLRANAVWDLTIPATYTVQAQNTIADSRTPRMPMTATKKDFEARKIRSNEVSIRVEDSAYKSWKKRLETQK